MNNDMISIPQLETDKNYYVTIKRDLFYPVLFKYKKPTVVLTVFSSKIDNYKLDPILSYDQLFIATPKQLIRKKDKIMIYSKELKVNDFYCVVEEPYLLDSFKQLDYLVNLNINYIFLHQKIIDLPFSVNFIRNYNKKYVECFGREKFYIIFTLFYFDLFKNRSVVFATGLNKKKLTLFRNIFNLNYKVFSKPIQSEIDNAIVFDDIEFNECQNIIYLFKKEEVNSSTFNYNRMDKYKYRIDDVLNALSPAVLKGKKELDVQRFKHLAKNK